MNSSLTAPRLLQEAVGLVGGVTPARGDGVFLVHVIVQIRHGGEHLVADGAGGGTVVAPPVVLQRLFAGKLLFTLFAGKRFEV